MPHCHAAGRRRSRPAALAPPAVKAILGTILQQNGKAQGALPEDRRQM